MKFHIEYFTKWGENLVLRAGDKAYPMSYVADGKWAVEIAEDEFFGEKEEIEYYYEVLDGGLSTRHEWRSHELKAKDAPLIVEDIWSDIPGWKGAGTAVPVFALRSEDDFGVGDFRDLARLVDWAAATSQTVIQLLPVNDTTMKGNWEDSYPYNANSTFALHPQFLSLEDMGIVKDEEYEALRKELNSLEKIDYEKVNRSKDLYTRKAYENGFKSLSRTDEYKSFIRENSFWLIPYAAFRVLLGEFGTPVFGEWKDMAVFSSEKLEKYCRKHKKEIDYHCFVQYHLDRQLRAVRNYAHSKGVILKGDLPIGISRTSAEAWQFPNLFNMDSQAGAPPDFFSDEGQNWGFPTYNWEEMEKDGFDWWKRRLKHMSRFFDAFRIDHILGFFRIWEIPSEYKSGKMGHFNPALPHSLEELEQLGYGDRLRYFLEDPHRKGYYHPKIDEREALGWLYDDFFFRRHNEFWRETATNKLSNLLGATNMLACGEDLGMIPDCVPGVMRKFNILSLELQSMPKIFGETFGEPSRYPYDCVCTTSTHDINPIRAWWEEERERTQRYFNEKLWEAGPAPKDCEPWICRKILDIHLKSPAMLAIFPIQDWLSIDAGLRNPDPNAERINVPSICPYNWCYRMHVGIEKILGKESFNAEVKRLIEESNRK